MGSVSGGLQRRDAVVEVVEGTMHMYVCRRGKGATVNSYVTMREPFKTLSYSKQHRMVAAAPSHFVRTDAVVCNCMPRHWHT